MSETTPDYKALLLAELEQVPPEYLPALLTIVRAFRESVVRKQLKEELQESLLSAEAGRTYPIDTLWDEIERE